MELALALWRRWQCKVYSRTGTLSLLGSGPRVGLIQIIRANQQCHLHEEWFRDLEESIQTGEGAYCAYVMNSAGTSIPNIAKRMSLQTYVRSSRL